MLSSFMQEMPMNHPPPEERLPGSSYRNRYPFILPSKSTVEPVVDVSGHHGAGIRYSVCVWLEYHG